MLTELVGFGLALVPVPLGEKDPIKKDWNIKANSIRNAKDIAALNNQNVGLARPFISYKIADGTFPSPIKLSKRASSWSATEIDAWIQERIALRGGQHDRS